MRNVVFGICVLGLSSGAIASDNAACRMKGEIFETAARSRDQGMPPETALGITSGYLKSGHKSINNDFLKKAINAVYFDPGYANARGPLFRRQITDLCLNNGKPKYQPIK